MKESSGPRSRKSRYYSALAAVVVFSSGHADTLQPRLWISDDVSKTIYQTDVRGKLRRSFKAMLVSGNGQLFPIGPSAVAVDSDGTLWVTAEFPGRIIHYSRNGEQLGEPLASSLFGAVGPEGIAVTADPTDDTLWVIDDPDDAASNARIYHITGNGSLIASFPSPTEPDPATGRPLKNSPQAIAVDPLDETLWITDNATQKIYHLDRSGNVIAWLAADSIDPAATNLQGISVAASDSTLWLTDRATDLIYNITRNGVLLSSFPTSSYDSDSNNPTGISFALELVEANGGVYLDDFEN